MRIRCILTLVDCRVFWRSWWSEYQRHHPPHTLCYPAQEASHREPHSYRWKAPDERLPAVRPAPAGSARSPAADNQRLYSCQGLLAAVATTKRDYSENWIYWIGQRAHWIGQRAHYTPRSSDSEVFRLNWSSFSFTSLWWNVGFYWFYTRYSLAQSTTRRSVSLLHHIVRLVLFLSLDWYEDLKFTTGACHDRFLRLQTQRSTTELSRYSKIGISPERCKGLW